MNEHLIVDGLYPDQHQAMAQFKAWLASHHTCAGLWAGAGFGKSHMCKDFLKLLAEEYRDLDVRVASTTHAACGALEDLILTPVNTIHSTMKWIPSYDRKTGEEYLKTPKKSVMTSNMLILVDEAGMLGHTETNLLIDEARMVGALIFFVGDHKQCYGVFKKGEEVCVPAYRASTIKITLDIPKRQTEGDYIYALSLRLRAAVDGHRLPILQTLINPDDGKGIVHVDDIEPVMFSMFHAAKKLVDSGEDTEALFKVKVLAFTNNKCINLNRKIRREVFGVKDSVPFIGEVLMANKSVPSPLEDGDMLLKNNEYVTVKSVELDTVQGLSGFWLTFEENDSSVFSPKSIDSLKNRLQVMAKEAKENNDWAAYYRLKNGVADMRNIYAQTVNKAQGSTLKEVCVMMDNIDSCRDESQKRRLAYTAVSRGTHKVYVEGELT